MTRQTECIGSLYAEFLAAGGYDNARAALDVFRAAKWRTDNDRGSNRIYGNGSGGAGISGAVRGEYGRA